MRSATLLSLSFVLAAAVASPAAAMTFERIIAGPCAQRQCLGAVGPIDKATIQQLREAIAANRLREGALVFVSSPGGDLVGGITLGQEIRKRGFNTFVAAYDRQTSEFIDADCASACFYMFIGGVRRGSGEGSRVGVHQLVLNNPGTASQGVMSAQWYMGLAADHLLQMGADPKLTALALSTPAGSMRWLSRKDLRSSNAITVDNTLHKPRDLGALSFFDVATQP